MDHLASAIMTRSLVTPSNPAADTEWEVTVSAEEFDTPGAWLLKCVTASLAAGSTNVQPVLIIDDGAGHVIAESVGATAAQSSGTTCTYCWSENFVQSGLQGSAADVHSQSPLPMGTECLLQPGWRILTHTIGLNSTSAWTKIVLYVLGNG